MTPSEHDREAAKGILDQAQLIDDCDVRVQPENQDIAGSPRKCFRHLTDFVFPDPCPKGRGHLLLIEFAKALADERSRTLNLPEVVELMETVEHCFEKEAIVYHDGTPWNECFENCRRCALEKAMSAFSRLRSEVAK